MIDDISILPLGDSTLIIRLGDRITDELIRRVTALTARLDAAALPGVIDVVPAYASIAVHYDPARTAPSGVSPFDTLRTQLLPLIENLGDDDSQTTDIIELPIYYGGEFGPDIDEVARYCNLSIEEVIALHSEQIYRVAMIGFLPGFPYLAGMRPELAMPRRETPRVKIAAGSVGIGGEQTGVYPIESPGGWNIIGRTPARLFLPENDPPTLLHIGDRIRFKAISRNDHDTQQITNNE